MRENDSAFFIAIRSFIGLSTMGLIAICIGLGISFALNQLTMEWIFCDWEVRIIPFLSLAVLAGAIYGSRHGDRICIVTDLDLKHDERLIARQNTVFLAVAMVLASCMLLGFILFADNINEFAFGVFLFGLCMVVHYLTAFIVVVYKWCSHKR